MPSRAIVLRPRFARRATYAPRPIVVRTTRVIKPKHKRHRYGRRSEKIRMGVFAGAFALGLLDKAGVDIPTLPYLGKAGTIAVAAWAADRYLHVGHWADDVATAAGSVALYELGKEGSISGEEYVTGDF